MKNRKKWQRWQQCRRRKPVRCYRFSLALFISFRQLLISNHLSFEIFLNNRPACRTLPVTSFTFIILSFHHARALLITSHWLQFRVHAFVFFYIPLFLLWRRRLWISFLSYYHSSTISQTAHPFPRSVSCEVGIFFPVLLPLVKTIFPFFFASKNHSKLLEVSNEHLKNKKEIWRTKWNYKKDKEQRGFLVCYQAFLTIRILWTNKKYDTFNGLMKNLSFAWSCWACLCCCAYESYSFHN